MHITIYHFKLVSLNEPACQRRWQKSVGVRVCVEQLSSPRVQSPVSIQLATQRELNSPLTFTLPLRRHSFRPLTEKERGAMGREREGGREGDIVSMAHLQRARIACWESAGLVIERLRVRIPAGAVSEFYYPALTLCADSCGVRSIPLVTAVARKRPRSFCQKCGWHVTPKCTYTFDPT